MKPDNIYIYDIDKYENRVFICFVFALFLFNQSTVFIHSVRRHRRLLGRLQSFHFRRHVVNRVEFRRRVFQELFEAHFARSFFVYFQHRLIDQLQRTQRIDIKNGIKKASYETRGEPVEAERRSNCCQPSSSKL
jgi:hypothetical protein